MFRSALPAVGGISWTLTLKNNSHGLDGYPRNMVLAGSRRRNSTGASHPDEEDFDLLRANLVCLRKCHTCCDPQRRVDHDDHDPIKRSAGRLPDVSSRFAG